MSASNDGSESVDQFLARIASLSEKKDNEDVERSRKKEEDMMQARRERQARRAERARSISPVKTGPTATLPSPRPTPPSHSIEPPVALTPRSQTQTPTKPEMTPPQPLYNRADAALSFESTRPLPRPPEEHTETSSFQSNNATSLSRSGTLSWQQRPLSRGTGSVRTRPFSGARSPVRGPTESPKVDTEAKESQDLSRQDIAASLGAKDPSWFRQTQDRGVGSAAYRKTQNEEPTSDVFASRAQRLHGMPSNATEDDNIRSQSRDEAYTTTLNRSRNQEDVATADPMGPPLTSTSSMLDHPKPLDSSLPNKDESSLGRSLNPVPGRSPSPTKGLGGFVESAMMKRSDSVNKRWSVRATPGLKRGDSVAGNRPGFNPPTASMQPLGHARTLSRDPRPLRDGTSSPISGSRPSSSHQDELQIGSKPQGEVREAKSQSPEIQESERPVTPPQDVSLSRSPSKTLDPRRWSPTKASWLESALSKPESPRPAFAKPEAPSWKIGLDRSRSQKAHNNLHEQTTPSFAPVSTTGFLRSPPMGSETSSPSLANVMSPPRSPVKRAEELRLVETDQSKFVEEKSAVPSSDILSTPSVTPQEPVIEPKVQPGKPTFNDQPSTKEKEADSELAAEPSTNASELVAVKQPPALKPKPKPSPEHDFRARLKNRDEHGGTTTKEEPEFKSVFGKLKPTQTQNYKAPDVLRDNISRGKAALNITGGPQRTKRVDEFKESILQQKEAMRAGGGSVHKKPDSMAQKHSDSDKPDPEIPEALARRKTLHKTKASADDTRGTLSAATRDVAGKPDMKAKPEISPASKVAKSPPPVKSFSSSKPEFTPAKPHVLESRPPKESNNVSAIGAGQDNAASTPEMKPTAKPILPTEASYVRMSTRSEPKPRGDPTDRMDIAQGPLDSKPDSTRSPSPGKHNLAARLNPALAGLIARSNSPKPAGDSPVDPTPPLSRVVTRTSTEETQTGDSGTLTHATKGRARGPKRRAPKAEATVGSSELPKVGSERQSQNQKWEMSSIAASTNVQSPAKKSENVSPSKFKAKVESPVGESQRQSNANSSYQSKTRPLVASKSPELRKVSGNATAVFDADRISSKASTERAFKIATDDASPETPFEAEKSSDHTQASSRSNTPSMPLTPSKTRLNTPRQPKPANLRDNDPTAKPIAESTGLGVKMGESVTSGTATTMRSPLTKSNGTVSIGAPTDKTDPAKSAIESVYGTIPRAAERSEFDTEAFLKSHTNKTERVKTISNQIWEVNSDGKRTTPAPNQEHILYEDSMYLSVHVFESENGAKSTEVYLWCGDTVGEAAIEDAQLFCRKVARENSAKLEVIKQGNEHTRFFSALGGIVITRRNKSSALYMLCGRRHNGHVAFDEVELSPTQLCSGFPFLISAKFGKLYLWKGQGSGADEIGAARLIGMDLGLTGEMEEVEEGAEPAGFWDSFLSASRKQGFTPSEVWSMRSADQHQGFPCKLYRVENERPKSSGGLQGLWGLRAASPPKASNKAALQEIAPFSQRDLDPSNIHLLDAYSTIYVLPGASSSSKAVEFVTSLHIAQELAVLLPSVQDRALLPSCEVVFGEPPADFRAAFRKWVPETRTNQQAGSGCFEVADVLRKLG